MTICPASADQLKGDAYARASLVTADQKIYFKSLTVVDCAVAIATSEVDRGSNGT